MRKTITDWVFAGNRELNVTHPTSLFHKFQGQNSPTQRPRTAAFQASGHLASLSVKSSSRPVFQLSVPYWFSCDWLRWGSMSFFYVRTHWYNLSPADTILTHAFKIPGTLRPLAFSESAGPIVLVAAGAEYYLWDGDALTLIRFGADFDSDEDFLARHAGPEHIIDYMGVVEDLPADYDDLYWRLDAEQRRLASQMGGGPDSLLNPRLTRRLRL
ncbi:hypothetical protein B0H11DRAFT_2015690 [Mycena galericulata]|nr:hypothetical protein B0H11DRAFT_2015690 [Mycena galericulata]